VYPCARTTLELQGIRVLSQAAKTVCASNTSACVPFDIVTQDNKGKAHGQGGEEEEEKEETVEQEKNIEDIR
jgi:hypothetical protein